MVTQSGMTAQELGVNESIIWQ